MRNRPIRQLIKWFVNREKGKVVEARSGIRRRFPYIDWSDQKNSFWHHFHLVKQTEYEHIGSS